MHNVTLYIPGLFHFIPEFSPEHLAELKSLKKLLNLGEIRQLPPMGYLERVGNLFGLNKHAQGDIPYAAITRLAMDDSRPTGAWILADPVHLKPSNKGLTLYDARQFALSRHDIVTIATLVNPLFKECGYELEVPDDRHWYLKLPSVPNLSTNDLYQTAGQDIAQYLPQGEDDIQWLKLLNEVQMLLHDSEVNRQRQQRGELPVNSLWFWGTGELPRSLPRHWSRVFADAPLIQGLCMLSSADYSAAGEYFEKDESSSASETLIILNNTMQSLQYDEPSGWLEAMTELDGLWLKTVLEQLQHRHIQQLRVISGTYEVSLKSSRIPRLGLWQRSVHSFFEKS